MRTFDFVLFGIRLRIDCPDALSVSLVVGNFGVFEIAEPALPPHYSYKIERALDGLGYAVFADHRPEHIARDAYELMYCLEKFVTVDVQLRRPDLFFVHAAALQRTGRACLLVAPPGSGKSTTAWALLHNGFGYLSDELAPVDLDALTVLPYPHALCLKRPPPAPYALPPHVIATGRTLHVPAAAFASNVNAPVPLACIFFNQYDPTTTEPAASKLSAGAASALLYANGLNQLAHSGDGLAAAAAIAGRVGCYRLTTADLTKTCELVASIMTG